MARSIRINITIDREALRLADREAHRQKTSRRESIRKAVRAQAECQQEEERRQHSSKPPPPWIGSPISLRTGPPSRFCASPEIAGASGRDECLKASPPIESTPLLRSSRSSGMRAALRKPAFYKMPICGAFLCRIKPRPNVLALHDLHLSG